MPIPKPKNDEDHDEFMDRCMGDDVMNDEYPDEKSGRRSASSSGRIRIKRP